MRHIAVRKLTYYLFIVIFLITAPLLVLYTYGYRWAPEQGITRTGTLFIVTAPRDADVFIDGHRQKDRTPSILKWLTPGEKLLRIEKQGYLPWEKRLTIERTRTTFADDVHLFLEHDLAPLVLDAIHRVAWSPDDQFMAYTTSDRGWTEVWISPIDQPAARLVSRIPTTETVGLTWTRDDVVELTIDETSHVQFDTSGKIVTPEEEQTGVRITSEKDIVRIIDGEQELATLATGTYEIHSVQDAFIVIHDADDDAFTLFQRQDTEAPIAFTTSGTYAHWYGSTHLLIADTREIQLFDVETGTLQSLLRQSEPVHSVQWHPSGHYIFYATSTDVWSIELDNRGEGRQTQLLSVLPEIQSMNIDDRGRELYIAGNDGIDQGIFIRPLR